MQLTLTQAATLMGVSPRTLRDRVARGDVPGVKRGGRWTIDSHEMLLSETQRRAMQARAALPARRTVISQQRCARVDLLASVESRMGGLLFG